MTVPNVAWLHLDVMPYAHRLARRGVTFTNAGAETPVCYSSRANMLYGQSAARTGIVDWFGVDIPPAIAAGRWSYEASFASWLTPTWQTLTVGKYLNDDSALDGESFGWTRYRQPQEQHAHRITDVNNGDGIGFQAVTPIWHTDWAVAEIGAHAAAAEDDGDPWLAYWPSSSPHADHAAIPGNPHAFADLPEVRYDQHGTGWPSWITARPVFGEPEWEEAHRVRRAMARESHEVDAGLAALGLDLATTLVIVSSDNGSHKGDHRISGNAAKNTLYEPAFGIPLVIAGPGFPRNRRIDVPVNLQDIVATLTAIADVTPPHPVDGVDLRAVAWAPEQFTGRAILGRRKRVNPGDTSPATDWISTGTRKLARHYATTGSVDPAGEEYEMYDLDTDPGELTNVAYEPGRLAERDALEAELDGLLAPT